MTAGCIRRVLAKSSWWTNSFAWNIRSYILAITKSEVLAAMMITGYEQFKGLQGDYFIRSTETLGGGKRTLLVDKFFIRLPGAHTYHHSDHHQALKYNVLVLVFLTQDRSRARRQTGHWTKPLLSCEVSTVIFQVYQFRHLLSHTIKENNQTIRKHLLNGWPNLKYN